MNLNLKPFEDILTAITGFIDLLIPVVFAIALLVFIWGVYQYFILGGAQEEKRESGKQLVMWAIIGFVIMVSVWGIVNLLVNSLGFTGDSKTRPCLPTFSGDCNTN